MLQFVGYGSERPCDAHTSVFIPDQAALPALEYASGMNQTGGGRISMLTRLGRWNHKTGSIYHDTDALR